MRTFISIKFPEEIKKQIIELQKKIENLGMVKGKVTEKENLHLTLKFLGEITDDKLNQLKEKLRQLKFDEFEVELGELGVFSEKFIRIIWISLKGKQLFELQKDVDECLEELFKKENRFMAHITICRTKFVKDKEKFIKELKKIKLEKIKFKVDKFYLEKSELTKQGARYFNLMTIEKYN